METTNNFKPILFSTEMVQAILAGRKTQTRRVLKLKTPVDIKGVEVDCYLRLDLIPTNMQVFYANKKDKQINLYSDNEYAKYKPGDVLWVRETWQTSYNENSKKWDPIYKADGKFWMDDDGPMKWKPSLFMVKKHCRIFLKVTNVRCERLQDIPREDCFREGIAYKEEWIARSKMRTVFDYHRKTFQPQSYGRTTPSHSFQTLWDSINAKKHPWKSNPWVWVYEFERIEKPENFNNKNL